MEATIWAFVPAIIAIVLALFTKQVYISLFVGIFTGAMFLAKGNPVEAVGELFVVMQDKVGGNVSIIVFLVVLGMLVALMTKSGGSKAYGEWATKKIKTKRGALLATSALGMLIFVDDYFNCLTVGNVMRPITDKHRVSRAKLAYIIDATAAPVCIIAPISSWAAAVSGELEGDGLIVFIKTIPFNLYAILTLVMIITFCLLKIDFFKMGRNERIAEKTGDLLAGETELPVEESVNSVNKNGKVMYLLVPIVTLILCCVGGMIYTGYFYNSDTGHFGKVAQSANLLESFSNCDAGLSLATGSTIALVITIVFYAVTRALPFKEMMLSLTDGFKSMVPAILILTFAWTLSGIMGANGGYLDARGYVEKTVNAESLGYGVIPAVFFLLACGISFATGTSWGTFGILIPISTAVMGTAVTPSTLLTVSAVLAGAVYGDHVSPISDTTILSSSGAQCNHLDHVRTQLPYATIVAAISFIGYLIAGFASTRGLSYGALASVTLGTGIALFAAVTVALVLIDRKGGFDKLNARIQARKAKKNSPESTID